jgi:hypothetical protein
MIAQAESRPTTTLANIKAWLALASLIVVLAGGIAAGLLGGMKLVIAPCSQISGPSTAVSTGWTGQAECGVG